MELEVVNVGQGNWNVLKIEKFNLFYDLGASKNENETNIKTNIIEKNCELFNTDFGVIISHWDIDHYRLIISLAKLDYLKKMKFFVCPENLPTLTSEKAYNIIKTYLLDSDIYKVPNIEKGAIIGRRGETPYKKQDIGIIEYWYFKGLRRTLCIDRINMNVLGDFAPTINLYHSVERKNRNKNSLVMVLNYSKDNYVIFTGDSYYRDLNEYIFKDLPSLINNICFVVPHHGGAAGKFVFNDLKFKTGNAFISVGKNNSYGHPNEKYVKDLITQFGSANVRMTKDIEHNFKVKL